jgi:nucleotide-binding universal stress UspA family protein
VSGAHRVVVGVSASPGSLPALRYAGGIALRQDLELVAVHAWVPPGGDLADRRYPSAYLRRTWADAAALRLREAIEAAWGGGLPGLTVRRVVVRGEPGPALVDLAEVADVLVIGAGRRGWPGRLWHSRVSRYCLSHSRGPVIAVPPSALARSGARGRAVVRELTGEVAQRASRAR